MEGSWGGANMFNPGNAVDNDSRHHTIPPNAALIKGSSGYGPTYAAIYVNPQSMAPLLPTNKSELTDKQKKILAVFAGLISSARPDALRSLRATAQEIEDLIAGGYLKKNKAGHIAVTTLGRNNIAQNYWP